MFGSANAASAKLGSSKSPAAMIVHSKEEAEKTEHLRWINPNSLEYRQVVMEHKINQHEKTKNTGDF